MTKTLPAKAGKTLPKNALHGTSIDLAAEIRLQVTAMLNRTLAETLDLATQVKQAHWNVKGPHFYQLHLLFDELAGELMEFVDDIAERVTALGGTAYGTIHMAVKSTTLPEYPEGLVDGADHVKALVERYALYCASVRATIDDSAGLGDASTADLYTEVSRAVDKRLWFLESHLHGGR